SIHAYYLLRSLPLPSTSSLFFFTHPPTTDIYTLSLHDALPISFSSIFVYGTISGGSNMPSLIRAVNRRTRAASIAPSLRYPCWTDRKSTRLNSSHRTISYAVFCLKKKKKKQIQAIYNKTDNNRT